MSLFFADGFEHYTTVDDEYNAQLVQTYDSERYAALKNDAPRTGNFSLGVGTMRAASSESYLAKNLPANVTNAFFGWSVYCDAGSWKDDVRYRVEAGDAPNYFFELRLINGTIKIYINNILRLTSDFTLSVNAHHYIEMEVNNNGVTSGSYVAVRVNGADAMIYYYTSTRPLANFEFYGAAQGIAGFKDVFCDDFYIVINDGVFPSGFLGDIKMKTLTFSEDVASDWVSTEATNWEAIKAPHEPNTNITATGSGDVVRMKTEPLGLDVAAIYGMSVHFRAAKTDSGAATIAAFIESEGQTETSIARTLSTTSSQDSVQFNVSPKTGEQITRDEYNAMTIGFIQP